MSKKSPEQLAADFLERRSNGLKKATASDTIYHIRIGEYVCAQFAEGKSVSLDVMLADCVAERDALTQQANHDQSTRWHALNAVIDHLQSLAAAQKAS